MRASLGPQGAKLIPDDVRLLEMIWERPGKKGPATFPMDSGEKGWQ
jgi:hypothetical protein